VPAWYNERDQPPEYVMTQLLDEAFREAQKLSEEGQDALALRILDELRDEQRWHETFARTSDEQWDRLAGQVREEIASGDTEPLADL
jgi:hypothetical protein